ncbi:MAG: endonuclease/exonuclease/phosphatase family protein [Acidimicrobiia bacterium]|nr:endonuclease/exonuclease/phosphatase family protein [Acidimicrobiia bacterium]
MTATAEQPESVDTAPAKRPRRLARLFILGILGVTLAGFFGSWYWGFDIIANARYQYFLAALPVLLIGGLRRDRVVLGVATAVLVANAVPMAPIFFGSGAEPSASSDSLRVLTFNVFHRNANFDEIIDVLETSDADVIFVHELSQALRRTIESELDGYAFAMEDGWGFASGSGALVRDGLAVVPTTLRIGPSSRFPTVALDLAGSTVDVVGVHPLSPVTPRRSRARDRTLDDVAAWAVTRPGEVVVVGDFNASPFSSAYRSFGRISGLSSTLNGAGWQATWPDMWGVFQIPIDHAFISDGLAVTNRMVGGHAGSDHAALIIDVAPAA